MEILPANISVDGISIDKTEISSPTDQELILDETINKKLESNDTPNVPQIDIKIETIHDEVANINKQIRNRIKFLETVYNIKKGYIIYRKPAYTENWVKNIIIYLVYQLDFLIDDLLNMNKYYVTTLHLKGDTVTVNAHSPQEVAKLKGDLGFWFNSITGMKIIINKAYYDCDFVKTEA